MDQFPDSLKTGPRPAEQPTAAEPKFADASSIGQFQERFEALVRELNEARRERDNLARRLSAVPPSSRDAAAQLAEAQKAMLSIRQARDTVVADNHKLIEQLARAEDQVAEIGFQRDALERARNAAVQEAEDFVRQFDEFEEKKARDLAEQAARDLTPDPDFVEARLQITALAEERDAARVSASEQAGEIGRLRAELEFLRAATEQPPTVEPPAGQRVRDGAPGARDQMEHRAGEGESRRAEFDEYKAALGAKVAAIRSALAIAREAPRRAAASNNAGSGLAELFQLQSHATLELTDRLDHACQELGALAALLADAGPGAIAVEAPAPAAIPEEELSRPAPLPRRAAATEPRDDTAVALDAVCRSLDLLERDPGSASLRKELDLGLVRFSEHARSLGQAAAHRLSATCLELIHALGKTPAKITRAKLEPLAEALEFVRVLTDPRHSKRAPDPTGAIVYALDSDPDNCECLAMALEKMALQPRYATKTTRAIAELAAGPCDLIILDADSPGVDGFALCAQIRGLDPHAKTPMIFLSGVISARDHAESPRNGESIHLSKPCNIYELGLKALMVILQARLA